MDKVYVKSPDFVQREIAGEFLLIPIRRQLNESNSLYVMNETGTSVWKQIDGNNSLSQIKQIMLTEFEVAEDQLEKDIEALIENLVEIQAIREKCQ